MFNLLDVGDEIIHLLDVLGMAISFIICELTADVFWGESKRDSLWWVNHQNLPWRDSSPCGHHEDIVSL